MSGQGAGRGGSGGKRLPTHIFMAPSPTPMAAQQGPGGGGGGGNGHSAGKRPPPSFAQYEVDDDESDESSSGSGALPTQPILGAPTSSSSRVHPAVMRMQLVRQQKEAAAAAAAAAVAISPAGPSADQHLDQTFRNFFAQNPTATAADLRQPSMDMAARILNERRRVPQGINVNMAQQRAVADAARALAAANHRMGMPSQLRRMSSGAPSSSRPLQSQSSAVNVSDSGSTKPEDAKKALDPLTTAGVDVRSERMQLSRQFEEDVSDARRTLSAAQVEEEQYRLEMGALKDRISKQARKHGLTQVAEGVLQLICLASQERLKNLIDQLIEVSKRRIDIDKGILPYVVSSEPHQVLKRVQKAEEIAKKERQMKEKLRLLEEAKASRARKSDEKEDLDERTAEHLRQVEDEELNRQRNANMNDAAVLAMGGADFTFKKRTKDSAAASQLLKQQAASNAFLPPSAVAARRTAVQDRIVTLQDCLFVMERERHLCKSTLLYKRFLRLGQQRTRHRV